MFLFLLCQLPNNPDYTIAKLVTNMGFFKKCFCSKFGLEKRDQSTIKRIGTDSNRPRVNGSNWRFEKAKPTFHQENWRRKNVFELETKLRFSMELMSFSSLLGGVFASICSDVLFVKIVVWCDGRCDVWCDIWCDVWCDIWCDVSFGSDSFGFELIGKESVKSHPDSLLQT